MTDFGKDLIESLSQAVAHAKGREVGATHAVEVPDVGRKANKYIGSSIDEFMEQEAADDPALKAKPESLRRTD